jgi:hypothetical protein
MGFARTACILLVLGVAGSSVAQPLERPDQMPGTPATRTSPPYGGFTDAATIRQANVNAAGLNIVGDAANEPSIAIDPLAPNRIVIGWRQFDTVTSNFRQAGYAWSNDGGRSWHFPGTLTPGNFRSDPVVETDSHGNFYYYSLPDQAAGWHVQIFKSADGGHTWTGPVEANGGDRAWFTIDKTRLASDGFIYGIWTGGFGCCGQANFGRDTSGGTLPWPAPVQMPLMSAPWGTVAVGPDAEVYIAGTGGGFRVLRSTNARDPGQTPSFDRNVLVNLGGAPGGDFTGPNPGGALGQTWVDLNRSPGAARGHVYVVGRYAAGADPADVGFSRSEDGGATWSPPVRVNADPPGANKWNWFPSLSVAPAGRIDVTYNANFESGNTFLNRTYYTFSTDEGQTWSPPEAVTPPWNSSLGYPQQNKIGDYYDQQSDDVGLFMAMAATLNNEQDVYFIRIGDWDCNQNGLGDALDLAAGTLHDCDGNSIPDECEIAAGAKPDANHNGIPDGCECYADCNGDGKLNLADFGCFQTRFALGDPYADCNGDGVRNLADFGCFRTRFALGCP